MAWVKQVPARLRHPEICWDDCNRAGKPLLIIDYNIGIGSVWQCDRCWAEWKVAGDRRTGLRWERAGL